MTRRAAALALATAALATAVGCDALPGRPDPAERYVRPDRVTDFEPLYALHCAGCHGADGRLGPARPLQDPLYLAVAGADVLRRTIAEGVPGTAMSAFAAGAGGPLTPAQVDALVDGLLGRWQTPDAFAGVALPPYGTAPGFPERGAAVYATYCADCHGADGTGTEKGGSIVDRDYLALASDQALRSAVIAGRIDLEMPDYRGYERRPPLAPQAISDVVAWMAARRPAAP